MTFYSSRFFLLKKNSRTHPCPLIRLGFLCILQHFCILTLDPVCQFTSRLLASAICSFSIRSLFSLCSSSSPPPTINSHHSRVPLPYIRDESFPDLSDRLLVSSSPHILTSSHPHILALFRPVSQLATGLLGIVLCTPSPPSYTHLSRRNWVASVSSLPLSSTIPTLPCTIITCAKLLQTSQHTRPSQASSTISPPTTRTGHSHRP